MDHCTSATRKGRNPNLCCYHEMQHHSHKYKQIHTLVKVNQKREHVNFKVLVWFDFSMQMKRTDLRMDFDVDDQPSSLCYSDIYIDGCSSNKPQSDTNRYSPTVAKSVKTVPENVSKSKRNESQHERPNNVKEHRHLITQHNYHDHAADPIVPIVNFSTVANKVDNGYSNVSSLTIPFPTKLYEMIEQIEREGLSHVMSWQPHGRCFKVHETHPFKILLSNYFKLSKLASFQRQLNLYGFRRLTVGLDRGSYYHELFLRGRPDLASQIERVRIKGTGVRAKANPDEEPNFYLYPPIETCTETAVVAPLAKVQQKAQATHAMNNPLAQGLYTGLTLPLFSNVSDIVITNRTFTSEDLNNADVSHNVAAAERCCSNNIANVNNGFIRSLSSLHFRSFGSNSTISLDARKSATTRPIDMQNATFPEPCPSPDDVSSYGLRMERNDRPIAAYLSLKNGVTQPLHMMTNDTTAPPYRYYNIPPEVRTAFGRTTSTTNTDIKPAATVAVATDNFHNGDKIDDDDSVVLFDKVIDDMFQHNDHDLSFYDLVQLATESDDNDPNF